jgi:hypothetical protein
MGTDLSKKISWEAASWNASKTDVQIMDKIRTVRTGGFKTLSSTGSAKCQLYRNQIHP